MSADCYQDLSGTGVIDHIISACPILAKEKYIKDMIE
jgi:hypothetical protein